MSANDKNGDDPRDNEAEWRLFKLGEWRSNKYGNGKQMIPHPIDRYDRATDSFCIFMREHLKAEMGEESWASRCEQGEHIRRYINEDMDLYNKHCDQNEYEATDHEQSDIR